MHARLYVAGRQRRQRVAGVDGDCGVLGLDPLPGALVVEDLERGDGLPEQQRHAAQVRVARRVQLADPGVLGRAARRVVHVAQVVLALVVVRVVSDEKVLVVEFEEDGKQAQQLHHDLRVAFAAESLNLVNVVLQYSGVGARVVAVKLGDVVDLDVVDDARGQVAEAGGAVAIVLAAFEVLEVVIFELFVQRQVVEFAAQGELTVDFFLADAEVFDVEKPFGYIQML